MLLIVSLMINGKTMKNLRKRINVRLLNNEKILENTPADQLISLIKYLINYAAIHEIKSVLTLQISVYLGFTVLELSK